MVCRKWEYHGSNENNPLQHIDLILVDDQGNTMYAEIPASEAEKHEPIVQAGQTYVISRFRVCNAKNVFKSVPAPYMIEFTYNTKISVATEEITGSKYIYTLTPFDKLPEYINDNTKFHDILGIITEINEPQWVPFSNQSNPSLRRDIKIKNEIGQEIKMALWGSKATQFAIPQDPDAEDTPIIILFTGCLVKNYFGELHVSGYTACHWYINPDIPEASVLLNSTNGQSYRIKRAGIPIAEQKQPETLPLPDLLTLKEMQDMDPYEFPTTGCRCTVTIIRLAETQAWWYLACNLCRRSCQLDGSNYKCFECDTTNKYTYKYKIPLIASDGTEESEMIAFATIAHRIVGNPVEAVMRSSRNRDNIPPDIAAIVSSKFTFSFTMSEASFRKPKKSYQVNGIIHIHGKQPALPFHGPNQAQLTTQNINFHAQTSATNSPPYRPQHSSETPFIQTPTEILPLEEMALQTPPKKTKNPGSSAQDIMYPAGATPFEAKSAKKRLHVPEKDEEQDEEDSSFETAPDKEKNAQSSSDIQSNSRTPESLARKSIVAKVPKGHKK